MNLENNPIIQRQKEIVHQIFEEERKKYQLEVSMTAVTIKEYYHTDIFRKKLKVKSPINLFYQLITPLTSCAWFDREEEAIIIILDHYQITNNITQSRCLAELIITIYHELKHRHQLIHSMNDSLANYRDLIIYLEYFVVTSNYNFYLNHHDYFMLEIDANQYSCQKAKEFTEKFPDLYHTTQDFFKRMTELYQYHEDSYNFQEIFEQFHKSFYKIASTTRLIDVNQSSFLSLFYHVDGTFKSLTEILNNPQFKTIDPRISIDIIRSRPFIKQLDFSRLTSTEKEYLIWLLEDRYQQESKRLLLMKTQTNMEQKRLKIKLIQSKELFVKLNILCQMLDNSVQLMAFRIEENSPYSNHNKIPYILQKKLVKKNKKEIYNRLPKIP